jgi:hypothetical protein
MRGPGQGLLLARTSLALLLLLGAREGRSKVRTPPEYPVSLSSSSIGQDRS